MTSATETQAPGGSCDSVAEASRATVVTVMPMSRSRVALFLVAGLTALVLLGAAGRVTTDAGSGGWVLHAQPVEVGPTTLDQPAVIVDAEWSAAKPVAKYRRRDHRSRNPVVRDAGHRRWRNDRRAGDRDTGPIVAGGASGSVTAPASTLGHLNRARRTLSRAMCAAAPCWSST